MILFDFETEAELDYIQWRCHTRFTLTNENASVGSRSLRMDFYPATYPGFAPEINASDIHCYKTLQMDVYHPGNDPVPLHIRMDDQNSGSDSKNRFQIQFIVKPGSNRLSISLDNLKTGNGRLLHPKKLCKFVIYMVNIRQQVVLYFDAIRLVS